MESPSNNENGHTFLLLEWIAPDSNIPCIAVSFAILHAYSENEGPTFKNGRVCLLVQNASHAVVELLQLPQPLHVIDEDHLLVIHSSFKIRGTCRRSRVLNSPRIQSGNSYNLWPLIDSDRPS